MYPCSCPLGFVPLQKLTLSLLFTLELGDEEQICKSALGKFYEFHLKGIFLLLRIQYLF